MSKNKGKKRRERLRKERRAAERVINKLTREHDNRWPDYPIAKGF